MKADLHQVNRIVRREVFEVNAHKTCAECHFRGFSSNSKIIFNLQKVESIPLLVSGNFCKRRNQSIRAPLNNDSNGNMDEKSSFSVGNALPTSIMLFLALALKFLGLEEIKRNVRDEKFESKKFALREVFFSA